MTANQDRPYNAATFIDDDDVLMRLYRTNSTPEVCLRVTDYAAAVSVRFNLNRPNLDWLIASLQRERELLAVPQVGERRQAPADHPDSAGCAAIRVEDSPIGVSQRRSWFVYRGSTSGARASGIWTTDAEVADWIVIQ